MAGILMLCEDIRFAVDHAMSMACDALEQIRLSRELIESDRCEEPWRAAVSNLYLALFNIYAVRAAMEDGVATDAASLHHQVLEHLGGAGANANLTAITAGTLQGIPPLGKLTLFAGLLREVTEAQAALPSALLRESDRDHAGRIRILVQRLGAEVVRIAEPLVASRRG